MPELTDVHTTESRPTSIPGGGTDTGASVGQPRAELDVPGPPLRLHWRSLSDGILISFLVAGPSLLAGFILRDQREPVWTFMVCLAAAGFLAGGAVAGRHRRVARGALTQGVVCAVLTATVIVLANIIRTAVLGRGISSRTVALWLGVEVGAILVGAVGGLLGRRAYIRSRTKKLSAK